MEELTQGRLKELLHYCPDTGVFTRRVRTSNRVHVGDVAGNRHCAGYWEICLGGKKHLAHRLAFLYMTGEWPKEHVDHINSDRNDNRWANLRAATNSENMQNVRVAREDNQSGLLGAHRNRRRYFAKIRVDGKTRRLGSFGTAQEAHDAYMAAKKELHPFSTIT